MASTCLAAQVPVPVNVLFTSLGMTGHSLHVDHLSHSSSSSILCNTSVEQRGMTIPEVVKKLVNEKKTLTSELARAIQSGEDVAPGKISKEIFSHHHVNSEDEESKEEEAVPASGDLEGAKQLGDFEGAQPSELFLTVSEHIQPVEKTKTD